MYVFLRSMSSHEDSTTGRNQEEKETEVVEEVEVEAEPVLGGVTEAVGRGGDDPAAGGGGGSVRVGGSGSSTFSDVEVRAMPPRFGLCAWQASSWMLVSWFTASPLC